MKNESLTKPFPNNLFDDLEVESPAEQPEDFLATLMYILRCIASPRDTKAFMMRYKDGKSFEEIGAEIDLTKQRAHYLIQDILCKFTKNYIAMLSKGIKKYMEDLLEERIEALAPMIEESERESIRFDAYEEGYKKGYEDGVAGRNADTANKDTLDNIDIAMLQLSNRTFNSLKRNGISTLGDVVACGDKIIDFETFGAKCFVEIAKLLKAYGVDIKTTFPMCVKKWGLV